MSDTPRMESVAGHARGIVDAGILAEGMKLERELNAANAIIRQQQLLDEENLSLKQRIKRLQEAGDAMLNAWLMPEDSMEYSDRITLSADAKAKWYSAKEAKP